VGKLSIRIDDYPGTKPAEFLEHNLRSFQKFDDVLCACVPAGVPVTLGVIPRYVGLEDLRELSQLNYELAIHGVDHDERPDRLDEFGPVGYRFFSLEEVIRSLRREQDRFEEMTGRRPTTYIPPHNVINNQTLIALHDLGFKRVMGGPGSEHCMPIEQLRNKCKWWELELVESQPPFHYGRSDELLQRGSIERIAEDLRTKDVCLTLHFPWETNIGLEYLRSYLNKLDEAIDATHAKNV
jgi:peptidoglycan/xylan/chitin deacetylase (PgdA/CDA1 family)